MLPEIAPEQYARALDSVAEDLLREAELLRVPVDMLELANALGIRVAFDARRQGGRALCGLGGGVARGRESRS